MFRSSQFTVATALDYCPVSGIVGEDVVKITRSGKDTRFQVNFEDAPVTSDIYSFLWYGVDTTITLDSGAYILQVYNSVTTFRTVLYEIGPTVGVGYVYVFKNGANIASYAAGALDTDENVRDGLEAAILAESWGFSVTTLATGTNQLRVIFSNTEDFETYIGRSTYKTGYYTVLSGSYYLVYYDDSPLGYPTLPALAATYEFSDLDLASPDLITYLDDPNTDNTYSETLEGTADINGVAGSGSVPDQWCVISDVEQRIYFHEVLSIGEVIKVYQK